MAHGSMKTVKYYAKMKPKGKQVSMFSDLSHGHHLSMLSPRGVVLLVFEPKSGFVSVAEISVCI